jgi:predicted transcriptional regulator of viral defense system
MTELLDIIQKQGVVRRCDVEKKQQAALQRLYRQGHVVRLDKGVYALPDQYVSLIQAVKCVPESTVCLLSALHFHGLTTQLPFEVWLAVPPKTPKPDSPPLRFITFSGKALDAGCELHTLHGVSVPIYNPAKTVADCFKHRNKIGLDVALEALKICWHERRCTLRELREYAEICGVRTVMQPYLEFLAV